MGQEPRAGSLSYDDREGGAREFASRGEARRGAGDTSSTRAEESRAQRAGRRRAAGRRALRGTREPPPSTRPGLGEFPRPAASRPRGPQGGIVVGPSLISRSFFWTSGLAVDMGQVRVRRRFADEALVEDRAHGPRHAADARRGGASSRLAS